MHRLSSFSRDHLSLSLFVFSLPPNFSVSVSLNSGRPHCWSVSLRKCRSSMSFSSSLHTNAEEWHGSDNIFPFSLPFSFLQCSFYFFFSFPVLPFLPPDFFVILQVVFLSLFNDLNPVWWWWFISEGWIIWWNKCNPDKHLTTMQWQNLSKLLESLKSDTFLEVYHLVETCGLANGTSENSSSWMTRGSSSNTRIYCLSLSSSNLLSSFFPWDSRLNQRNPLSAPLSPWFGSFVAQCPVLSWSHCLFTLLTSRKMMMRSPVLQRTNINSEYLKYSG